MTISSKAIPGVSCEQPTDPICSKLERQSQALQWVARLEPGRDVILAIDLTESVGLNDTGQFKLRQIIEQSLELGDNVYIVQFADRIIDTSPSFLIKSRSQVDSILAKIPPTDHTQQNTDIQGAELYVYQYLAQLNYDRLRSNKPIKSQSVIWVTDAPLSTPRGITSQKWIETPKGSPFRNPQSSESVEREKWLKVLPLHLRSEKIQKNTANQADGQFQITIVDIPPFVQDSCTILTGGRQECLVDPYIGDQLLLPVILCIVIILAFTGGIIAAVRYYLDCRKRWDLEVDLNGEIQSLSLANGEKIAIGSLDPFANHCINLPGVTETLAYLERKNTNLYFIPLTEENSMLSLNSQLITGKTLLQKDRFLEINYCHTSLSIQVKK